MEFIGSIIATRLSTTERDAITPTEGQIIYNTTSRQLEHWDDSTWQAGGGGASVSRDNYILVKQKSDLPTPSGGIITLTADAELNGTVDIGTDKINTNGWKLFGLNKHDDILVYTGTEAAINVTNNDIELYGFTVNANNGSVLAIDNSTSYNTRIFDVYMEDCNSLGTIKGGYDVRLTNVFAKFFNDGLTLDGIMIHLFIGGLSHFDSERYSGTGSVDILTFDSTFNSADTLHIITNHFHTRNTGDNIFNKVSGASFGKANVIGNAFTLFAGSNSFSNIDPNTDSEWIVKSNSGIDDYNSFGSMFMEDNTTVTTITTQNTWYKVAGTTSAGTLCRFSHTIGRLTYDAPETERRAVVVSLSCERSGGIGTTDYEFSIFYNGVKIPNVKIFKESSAVSDTVTLQASGNITQNGYVEIYVRNIQNTNNILVSNMQVTIR